MAVWKVRLKEVPEGLAAAAQADGVWVSAGGWTATGRVIEGLQARPGVAAPSPKGQGESRIWRLPGSSSWDLVVDERGTVFSGPDADGRVIVLVVPGGVHLPRSHAHAVAMRGEAGTLLGEVLERRVGVWGVHAGTMEGGGSWLECVFSAVRGALALLPLPEDERATVRVWVEERAEIAAGDRLRGLEVALALGYARVDGREQAAPNVTLRIVEKGEHPWVAWADVLAWCWAAGHAPLGRLVDLGLLPERGERRRDLLAAVLQGRGRFSAATFDAIAALPDDDDDLGGQLRLGVVRRAEDPGYRQQTLDHIVDHASSGRLDPGLLERQLRLVPAVAGASEPPPLALSRHIGVLAAANRRGEVPDVTGPRMAASMYAEEFPVLACQVALRVAVSLVNGLDLDGAAEVLRPWAEDHPANLDLRGRAWSGLGQVEACREDGARARACFTAATKCFERLTDAALKARNQAQTGAYVAQLAVEDAGCSEAEVEQAMVAAFGPSIVQDPSRSMGRADRTGEWASLALARWAAYRPDPRRSEQLMSLWEEGRVHVHDGHPWPLIHLYLGLAVWELADPADVVRVWREARDQALARGPALAWIGLAIDAARVAQEGGAARLEAPVERVLGGLPQGRPRWERARVALAGGARALEVVRAVLAFGFR